jgi:hypothetical protein
MAASYPGTIKTFTTKTAGEAIASSHINDLQAEVVAIETELKKTTGSTVDHGGLAGLSDNDHPQYQLLPTWTSYSPTVTSQSGTFTTVSATGYYSQINKVMNVKVQIVITNKGTAAGNLVVTLPTSAKTLLTDAGSGFSYTTASNISTTSLLVSAAPASSLRINKNDATTCIVDGQTIVASMTYEIA